MVPALAQGLNQNFGVLQSSFSEEEILGIIVFPSLGMLKLLSP